ncbi:hypothetical protein DL98DRAFT_660716 [Cadophora sp. DSE1049]|nr:hypothetical protein DL98DRAFT_660716 [Cadophora sp. DSE1049]
MGLFKSRSSKSKRGSTTTSTSTQSSSISNSRHPDTQSSQEPRTQQHEYHHDNRSLSNLSTTSTLQDPPPPRTRPAPPTRLTSYEAFVRQAQEAERERLEREDRIARAWMKAAERRSSAAWPADPWRGGFGPPARETYGGGMGGMGPRRVAAADEGSGVRAWLGQNGLVRN